MSSAGDGVHEERRVVLETCRVARWRGYVTSSFYAITEDGQVVAESAPFRWRGRDAPPDRPRHRAALDGLIAELVEHGWQLDDAEGRQWYDRSLTRPRVVAVSARDAEPAPALPPLVDSSAAGAAERRIADPLPQPPAVDPPPTARAVPAVTPVGPAAPPPSKTPRRRRRIYIAAAGTLAAGLAAAGAATFGAREAAPGRAATAGARAASAATPRRQALAARPRVATSAATRPARLSVKAAPREVPSRIRLVLTGHGSGSWVEVRRDSPSGAVLFSGDVGDGDRKAFSGRRLWIRLGAAANVTVSRDGAIVPLTGTVEKLLTAAPS